MAPVNRGFSVKLLFGAFVVVVGLLSLADNLGYLEARDYLLYWPVALIILGLVSLVQGSSKVGGVLALFVGSWILLYNLGVLDAEIGDFWPLLLIALGASIVWQSLSRQRSQSGSVESTVNAFALMSSIERKNSARDFLGGDLTAIMGGCQLDLTQAEVGPDGAEIDTFALWGGVEIKVPPDWAIISKVVPIMGGFTDHSRPPRDTKKRLVVKGMAIMGGVEIKN